MPVRSSGREWSKTGSSVGRAVSRFLLAEGGRMGEFALRFGTIVASLRWVRCVARRCRKRTGGGQTEGTLRCRKHEERRGETNLTMGIYFGYRPMEQMEPVPKGIVGLRRMVIVNGDLTSQPRSYLNKATRFEIDLPIQRHSRAADRLHVPLANYMSCQDIRITSNNIS
jgi:hypothetical protein